MAVREILIYPDPELKKVSRPVEAFDDNLQTLIDDMFETMYASRGVGLAAPQIGVLLRLVVVDCHGEDEVPHPLVLINPEILETSDEVAFEEGCLSVPGITAEVLRAGRVRFRATDRNDNSYEMEADGLLAIAVQHETDHLDGMVFVDRLSKLKRDLIRRKMVRYKEELMAEE